MNSVHFKRIVVFLLCLCCVMGSVVFDFSPLSVSAEAKSTEEYKDLIAELEKEQAEIQKEIEALKNDKTAQNAKKEAILRKIDNLQSQINACTAQLDSYDQQTGALQGEIATKYKELDAARFAYMQRLRAIYMNGGITASGLSVLLSAESLSDLLAKTELTRSINAYDSALNNKLINDVKLIEQKKVEIAALFAQQDAVKATLNTKKQELNKQVEAVKGEIADINSDMKDLEAQKKANEKAMAELEQAIKDASNVGSDQTYSGKLLWPVNGYRTVTSPYGYRIHPIYGYKKFHKGIDISGSGIKGKPILAAADGTVSIAKYNSGGYGYYVMVNHGKNSDDGKYYATLYAHMPKLIVSVGKKVKKGDVIGYVGTSGASKGYHLHYEVRRGTSSSGDIFYDTTDPMSYY